MTVRKRSRVDWRAILLCLALCPWLAASPDSAAAQSPATDDDVVDSLATTAESTVSVAPRIGIDGIYRIGYWAGLRVPVELADMPIEAVELLDVDGVRVRFIQPQAAGGASSAKELLLAGTASDWRYAVPGSAAAGIRLIGADDQTLWNGRPQGRAVDPSMPIVVVIGDPLGIDQIGRNELLGREASIAVARIDAVSDLPDDVAGWEAVDLLVINPAGLDLLGRLGPAEIAAIERWLVEGGQLFVSLGGRGGELLQSAPWLAGLVGVRPDQSLLRLDPGGLETFTTSQSPLADASGNAVADIAGYPLPVSGGRTLISGRTATRQSVRLAIERLVGLGRVRVTSFALDTAEMEAWPQRRVLLTRLHPGLLDGDLERRRDSRGSGVVAYDDIAGQVRSTLDRFDSHPRLPFSIVSLVLLILVAIIGPLDYWLINRLLGKPLIGWLSFPLSIVATVTLVILLGRGTAGDLDDDGEASPVRVNRLEVVDINATGDRPTGRAVGLIHVSSSEATRVDLPIVASAAWADAAGAIAGEPGSRGSAVIEATDADVDGRNAEVSTATLTRPHGYPGPTFGAVSITGADRSLPGYSLPLRLGAAADGSVLTGGPQGFPIAPAGSKAWLTRWSFRPRLGVVTGLSRKRGSELLTGSVTNPLSVDVLDGVVVFGNWVYLLPTRFRSGQTITSIESLRQKNFRWHLTRREALENTSRVDAWDVEKSDDLARLSEILMFESAVGGRDYTGLANRPLAAWDLSYVLSHGHAILFGRVEEPVLDAGLPAERPAVSAVRVILPVAPPSLGGR